MAPNQAISQADDDHRPGTQGIPITGPATEDAPRVGTELEDRSGSSSGAGACCSRCSGRVGRPASTLLSGRVPPGGMTAGMTWLLQSAAWVPAVVGHDAAVVLGTMAPATGRWRVGGDEVDSRPSKAGHRMAAEGPRHQVDGRLVVLLIVAPAFAGDVERLAHPVALRTAACPDVDVVRPHRLARPMRCRSSSVADPACHAVSTPQRPARTRERRGTRVAPARPAWSRTARRRSSSPGSRW